jgi:hypothetical protein
MNLERGAHPRVVVVVKPPKHPDVGLFLESGKSGLKFFVKHDPSLVFGFAYPADRAKFKFHSHLLPFPERPTHCGVVIV